MRVCVLALLLALCSASYAADGADGFVSIFNGEDLTGWVVMGNPEGFTVVDGCIHSEGGKGGNWIRTERPYANYVMRLEWMLSKTGNSGIFVRESIPEGKGFEVQLLAPWTPFRDDLHCTGSMYGFVPANPRPDETTLRWRKVEITCEYKHVKAAIDGVVTSEARYDRVEGMKDMPLAGYPGMQDSHTGPGEWVKFRNIEIKDLDQDPVFVAKGLVSSDSGVRRVAYDAAIKLGPPMIEPLLDIVGRGIPYQAHAGEMAISRIVAQASARDAQREAEAVRSALLSRLEKVDGNDSPERVLAARMLAIIGRDDVRTVKVLSALVRRGGRLSEAAVSAMRMIPGKAMADALRAVTDD